MELVAERILLAVDPEKCAVLTPLCCSLFFRYLHVLLESLDRVLLEFGRRRCERRKRPETKNPERRQPSPIAPRLFQRIHATHGCDVYSSVERTRHERNETASTVLELTVCDLHF